MGPRCRWLALLLAALLFCQAVCLAEGGGDGFYDLTALAEVREGEQAVLLVQRSYYSGETIYKGTTNKPLNGACALHCAAVLISNLRGEALTGQQVAKANNRDIRRETSWTPFVSWGKLSSAFHVGVKTQNVAQFSANLKQRGVKTRERRERKLEKILEIFREKAGNTGLILHFNSSGHLNGSGTHRHAVVLVGYVENGGEIVDLLVNDSSIPAPGGACVRMSESSLPVSILGKKKAEKTAAQGESLTLLLMDYAVSCRWIFEGEE